MADKDSKEIVTSRTSHLSSCDFEYDRARGVYVFSWIGLVVSAITAVVSIALGIVAGGLVTQKIDRASSVFPITLVPLLVNILILFCTECLGYIHSTSLRWTLVFEGRLDFNSSIRLFPVARTTWRHSRLVNLLYLLALTLSYAASPAILVKTHAQGIVSADRVTKTGLLCLGGGLLVQVLICLWCILSAQQLSWSSNPLTTGAVVRSDFHEGKSERCMESVHDRNLPATPKHPQALQGSLKSACTQVVKVIWMNCGVLIGLVAWSALASWAGTRSDARNWFILPDSYWDNASTPGISLWIFGGWSDPAYTANGEAIFFAQLLIAMVVQLAITIGLHSSELLVLMSRDETVWRNCLTPKGTNVNQNMMLYSMKHWPTILLLAFKLLGHWLYGLGMQVNYQGIKMNAPQLVYLTILWSLLLVLALSLALRKPKGPLPATYGHIGTLLNLVDDWSPVMYWGHKGDDGYKDGICHAGMSPEPLPAVHMDRLYMG